MNPNEVSQLFDKLALSLGMINVITLNPNILERNAIYDLTTSEQLN